jgi:hypothetical protein
VRPRPLPAALRAHRLAAKWTRVPHRLKSVACVNRPAAKCRSFYLRTSRSCDRAVMLITLGYPNAPHFHGHSTRKIHALIFTIACFRVLLRPNWIAFRRHSWSFANRLASLEAALRLATVRFSSAGLLPCAIHPGFHESFRSQFHRISDPPDDSASGRISGRLQSWLAPGLRNTQDYDFAFVFEARSNLRLAPPVASLCRAKRVAPLTKQSC